MRKYFLLFFYLFSFFGFSQDYYDLMAKETCECVNAKKIDFNSIEVTKLQMELGICLMPSYTNYRDKLEKSEQIAFGDREGMRKLGENIGLKMIKHCPDLIMKLGSEYIEKSKKDKVVIDTEKSVEDNLGDHKMECTFVETKTSDFLTVIVKEDNGRVHQLLLLNFFQNADLLTNNKLKSNQKIEVTYSEHEFYDPKTKDYKYYKVIYTFKVL